MTDALATFRDPPRHLSIDDPHYDPALGQNIEVWLDGYEQKRVLAYDCEAGSITRQKVMGFGEIVVEGGEVAKETVVGDVRVRWRVRP